MKILLSMLPTPAEVLQHEYGNNTVQDYLVAAGLMVGGLLIIRLFRRSILKRVRKVVAKSESKIDDLIVDGVSRFVLPVLSFMVIYWAINSLELSTKIDRVVQVASGTVIAYFLIRFISSTVRLLLTNYVRRQENGETKIKQITGLMIIVNIVIWVMGALLLFDNLGYDVTTVLAGVGIGGIAIALAAQNIMGDLFNYFVIFFDKPFEVGDAINIDGKVGTIEYIGLKTTRLRSLTGEQIVIANSDLTQSRLHNYKRQDNRRIQFDVSVIYDTPTEKLRKIPGIIRSIIEASSDTKFDRAHFARFTEYGLDFEVVYFITVPDYLKYMDIQQEINLQLMEIFKAEEIQFTIRERWMTAWKQGQGQSTVDSPQSTAAAPQPKTTQPQPEPQPAG
jgi:small-conductance mechanosensitive channel